MTAARPEQPFVAVIGALHAELEPLHQAARRARHRAVRTFQSGAGAAASRRTAEAAVAAGAGALVSWGLAGGLAAPLATGSVILATHAAGPTGAALVADLPWAEALLALLPEELTVHRGALLASDVILTTAAAKRAAAGCSAALGVDMETYAIAAVAAANELPWVAVRVVADVLSDRLPEGLAGCVDAAGNMRLRGLLKMGLSPGQWAGLARTAACYRRASRALALVATRVVPAAFAVPTAVLQRP